MLVLFDGIMKVEGSEVFPDGFFESEDYDDEKQKKDGRKS